MEDLEGVKLRRLGKLLGQQARIGSEILKLKAEVAALMGIGTGTASAAATSTTASTVPAPTIPALEPSPRKEQPVAPAVELKTKSPARAKQGQYMGLVRSLSEKDRQLVSAVRESQGVDEAINLAKRIRGKAAEKRGETPFDEEEGIPPTDGEDSPSFEDIV